MTSHQYVRVDRTLLKRGVTDFERKLKAAAASGALGYALVVILASFGVRLPASVAELIPLGIAILGGYSVHSSAVTTTFSGGVTADDNYSVRVGPVGVPVGEPKALTGAIPVPTPPKPVPEPDPVPYEVPDTATPTPDQSFTQVVTDQPAEARTEVYSPGDAFWQARNGAKSQPEGWGN